MSNKISELQFLINEFLSSAKGSYYFLETGQIKHETDLQAYKTLLTEHLTYMSPSEIARVYDNFMINNQSKLFQLCTDRSVLSDYDKMRYASASMHAELEVVKLLKEYRFGCYLDNDTALRSFESLSSPYAMIEEYSKYSSHKVKKFRTSTEKVKHATIVSKMKDSIRGVLAEMDEKDATELMSKMQNTVDASKKNIRCLTDANGLLDGAKKIKFRNAHLCQVVFDLVEEQKAYNYDAIASYQNPKTGLIAFKTSLDSMLSSNGLDMISDE